jgi:catechol 2,3-dioxygenase-like lactoylglutathione lyase family enzyme
MKRLHVHVSVDDLAGSIRFYSALFGAGPTVAKPDYAKWMRDTRQCRARLPPDHRRAYDA